MNNFRHIFTRHFSSVIAFRLVVYIALACGFKSDAQWQSELGGKKLTFAKTSGSISDRVDIWFYPGGEYTKKTQFSGYSGGGGGDFSMANENVEQGSWTFESGNLILKSQDGKVSEFSLSQGNDSNVIRLNRNGYLVTRHNECGN